MAKIFSKTLNDLLGLMNLIDDPPKKKKTIDPKLYGDYWQNSKVESGDYYEGTKNTTYDMPPMNVGQQLNVVNPKTSINFDLDKERLAKKEAILRNKKIYDEYQKRTSGKDSDAYDKSRGIIPYAKWDYSDKGTTTANEIFNKVKTDYGQWINSQEFKDRALRMYLPANYLSLSREEQQTAFSKATELVNKIQTTYNNVKFDSEAPGIALGKYSPENNNIKSYTPFKKNSTEYDIPLLEHLMSHELGHVFYHGATPRPANSTISRDGNDKLVIDWEDFSHLPGIIRTKGQGKSELEDLARSKVEFDPRFPFTRGGGFDKKGVFLLGNPTRLHETYAGTPRAPIEIEDLSKWDIMGLDEPKWDIKENIFLDDTLSEIGADLSQYRYWLMKNTPNWTPGYKFTDQDIKKMLKSDSAPSTPLRNIKNKAILKKALNELVYNKPKNISPFLNIPDFG